MKNEILIGVGGLILSVLTYFAGVRRTENRYKKIDKKDRMDAVFSRYMEFRSTNETDGLDGLLRAGVATLISDSEIRELIERITAHRERNPLGSHGELNNVDLKNFFNYAAVERIDFFTTPIDEIIKKSKA